MGTGRRDMVGFNSKGVMEVDVPWVVGWGDEGGCVPWVVGWGDGGGCVPWVGEVG